MKRFIFLLVIGLIFIVGCSDKSDSSSSSASGGDSGKTVKLIQGSWFPPTGPLPEAIAEWEEKVNELTGGEVEVETFHGSQLGQTQTVFPDVKGGVYDIGWISPILFDDTEMFPYTIANLPFAFDDPQAGANVMNKFFEKYGGIEEVVPLGITTSDPYIIMSKEPIKTLDDVKGLRVRAESAVQIEMVKSWGATPVPMPLMDIYEGLEKGTLDAIVMAISGGDSYNFLEVAPHVTYMPVSGIALIPGLNKESFEKMSEESQKLILEELGPEFAQLYTNHTVNQIGEIIERVKSEGEGEFIELTEEELLPFQTEVERIWNDWAKEANERGYPGDEMLEDFKTFIQEEGMSLPF